MAEPREAAPDVPKGNSMEANNKSLAGDLSKIAMGEMYSDSVLRQSVERLQALRDQGAHANSEITVDRITQALTHCKLALHGVRDSHHRLQDAAWLIAVADGVEAEYGKSVPANEHPLWKAQMEGLRSVTASLNSAMAPEAIKAEFDPAKLREYAEDVGMVFSGKVERAGVFQSSYEQHAARNGQSFVLLSTVDPSTYDADDVGPMYRIKFSDGEVIVAWPEEVQSALPQSKVAFDDDQDVGPDPHLHAEQWNEVAREERSIKQVRNVGFDDGSMGAIFTRDAQDGMEYRVVLMVPARGAQVTAHAALCKDGQVLVESAPMPRQSVLGALDAAVASLDDLKGSLVKTDLDPYRLLSRLQQDCEYYLGNGDRAKKHLWAGDEAAQIQKMKELYAGFREKPEWITPQAIEKYEAAMIHGKAVESDLDDAAVASLDDPKVRPAAQATTQAEAQALAERVAGEMGAALDDWVQTQAKEWARTVMTTEDGKIIRLGASTGGVVSVEGDPLTPGADRAPNVTHEAVSLSVQAAVGRALTPHSPIKTDRVFEDAPGELGAAWRNLCDEENRLAGYLTALEEGTAVVLGDEAWYLEKGDDGKLILIHGEVGDGKIKHPDSRFDFGLDWSDVELDEVRNYTQRVSSVADDFLIDPALWKTMKADAEASPSMSM